MKHQSRISSVRRRIGLRASQRGAALLVALILLVVITLVGLAAISGTILQNKMAANQYDRQTAFQATEAAMRQAAVAITTNVAITATQPAPVGIEDCSANSSGVAANVCLANPFADPNLATNGGVISTVAKVDFDAGALSAAQPQYVIQYMGCFKGPQGSVVDISIPESGSGLTDTYYFYRISARSGDPATVGGRSVVALQSMFRNQACFP